MVRRNGGRRAARRQAFAVQPLESRVLFSGSAEFVVHVSVDGLRPDAVTQLGAGRLPNFHRLRAEGAFTDNARTDYDYTITLPNHATQVTGRYVAGAAGHNWVTNTDPAPGETLHSNKKAYVASAWDVAHDAGLRTGLYGSKTKFSLFDESYDDDTASTPDPLQSGAPDADSAGGDNGRDKIDVTVINTDSVAMTTSFVDDMAADPSRYALVHYHDPDTAGHAHGWMGTDYFAALERVDVQLGRILALVGSDAALAGRTAIVLTADHGGEGAGHGDAADPEAYTIPFYVWGPGVTAGGDLYRMNADTRTDPGTGRPDNAAAPQPIRDGDAANLAMDFLGLASVPGSFFNAGQDLKVDVYSPPPPVTTTLVFQQGLNGYSGAVDTQVQSYGPDVSYGSSPEITVDGDEPPDTGHDSQGLVRFDAVFGDAAGQVRPTDEIVSARLELAVLNPGHAVGLHRMLRGWSGSDTWRTLVNGVDADGTDAAATADASFTPSGTGTYSIDVTAGLKAWAADPASNFGWAFLSAGTDGVDFYTAEGATRPRLVVETVAGDNTAPVAAADAYATAEDAALAVAAGEGVLANDEDAEGDGLSAVLVAGPSNGAIELAPDGSFVYTPHADFSGTDSFTYKATDGRADSEPATVTIAVAAVNDAPVAAGDAYVLAHDAVSLAIAAPGVLGNDADAEGQALTAAVAAAPAHGTLVLAGDGSFTYTPGGTFAGSDSFTYTVSDGAASATAAVQIRRNTVPVAAGDSYTVDGGALLRVAAPGVLANDSDADGDALSASVTMPPSNGALTLNADGSFTYAPAAGFTGADSFGYVVSDGSGGTAAATVALTVNPAPPVYATAETTVHGTVLSGGLGVDQSIRESRYAGNKRARLEQRWEFGLGAAGGYTFYVQARHDSAGEQFNFAYSTDNTTWSQMVTVVATSDTGTYQSFALPAGVAGRVFVRATDTNSQNTDASADTLVVEDMYFRAGAAATPAAPAAPGGLTAAAVSSSQINLAWSDNSENEDGFRVERSTDGQNFGVVATVGAGVTTYADTGLAASTAYVYRVLAFNAGGDSAYSSAAGATTGPAEQTAPTAPTGLTAEVAQRNKVRLKWLDNASNEEGFYVWISGDGVNWTRYATVAAKDGSGTTVQFTTGSLSGRHYFRVTAFLGGVESAPTQVVSVTI